MNNARIWLVVKPSIGIPVMLGTVVATALLVHLTILSHTTWYAAYLQGGKMPDRRGEVTPAPEAKPVKLGQTQTTPAGVPVVLASVTAAPQVQTTAAPAQPVRPDVALN
jgi:light-harvesting protein B-800-850 alpha chain